MRFHKQRCFVSNEIRFVSCISQWRKSVTKTLTLRRLRCVTVLNEDLLRFSGFFVDLFYRRFVTFHEVSVGFFVKMRQGETKDWIFLTDIVYVKTRKNARIAKVAIFLCTIVLTNLFARDIMFACQSDK